MNDDSTPSREDISCPRCGYDQRGRMNTWDSDCELYGICSECGLDYEWADLLVPMRSPPGWCVEYTTGLIGSLRSGSLTLLMLLRPRKFWRELKMSHVPRWGRIVWLHLVLAFLAYLALSCGVGLTSINDWFWRPGQFSTISVSKGEVFTHTVLTPFSNGSPGTYTILVGRAPAATRTLPIPSPREYTQMLLTINEEIRVLMLFAGSFILICPLVFLALPVSRRQAKVKWTHVQRITAYSTLLLWPLFIISVLTAGGRAGWAWSSWTYYLLSIAPILCLLMTLYLLPFWSLATKHHLRMRHAWGIGLSIWVIALLGSVVIQLMVNLRLI